MAKLSMCIVALVALGCVSVSSPSQAQDNATQSKALDEIRRTADTVCDRVEQIGRQDRRAIAGEAGATIDKLLKWFADVGIRLSGDLSREEYQGVPRENLAATLIHSVDCRKDVFDKLKDILIIPPKPTVPPSLIGTWTYTGITFGQPFEGTCLIRQLEDGRIDITGTRKMLTRRAGKRIVTEHTEHPWSSKMATIDSQKLIVYYTIIEDDGLEHPALASITLPRSEPFIRMTGYTWRLGQNVHGTLELTKSQMQ
jgi:hypothetical protein